MGVENRIYALTQEDVERASCLYLTGMKFREIAAVMGWSETLLWRVVRLCRECHDGPFFPRRKKSSVTNLKDQEVMDAAKKPKSTSASIRRQPTPAEWQRALKERGLKPSTVPSRTIRTVTPQEIHSMRNATTVPSEGQLA